MSDDDDLEERVEDLLREREKIQSEKELLYKLIESATGNLYLDLSLESTLDIITEWDEKYSKKYSKMAILTYHEGEEEGFLRMKHFRGYTPFVKNLKMPIISEEQPGISLKAAKDRKMKIVNDVNNSKYYFSLGNLNESIQAEIAIPLLTDNELLGVWNIQSEEEFKDEEIDRLRRISKPVTLNLKTNIILSESHNSKITDRLTGLYNREKFEEDIDKYIASVEERATNLTLLYIDIDNFKSCNDNYNHTIGDEVLKHFSDFLVQQSKDEDSSYRVGGDEFTVLLPRTNFSGGLSVSKRMYDEYPDSLKLLETRLNSEYDSDKIEIDTSLSIGVATYNRQESSEQFITRADSAMYSAKGSEDYNIFLNIEGFEVAKLRFPKKIKEYNKEGDEIKYIPFK